MKQHPLSFEEFLGDLLIVDDFAELGGDNNPFTASPHKEEICQAFCVNHGIYHETCSDVVPCIDLGDPEIVDDPSIMYGLADYSFPVSSDQISGESFESIGLAFGTFGLEKRSYGGLWSEAGISLTGDGQAPITTGVER